MAETPGSSVHDWRGPVRADYLAVPMTTGVQRPHRTLLRPAGDFVVTRQPVRVVAPALRHAKGLAPTGRIAVRVSSARHIGKPAKDVPTDEVLGNGDAPSTGPTVQPSGSVSTTDNEFTPDDDTSTTSGTVTPTRSSASAPTSAKPLPRPSSPRPPHRQVSTGPVPLPPQGVTPARSIRKPEDQVPLSRGDEPGESEVLPSEPLSDVLAAITVTEDGRTLTGRTRTMRRPGTRIQAQSSEQSSEPTPPPAPAPSAAAASPTTTSATSSPNTRPTPTRAHEPTRTPAETSNQVDAVTPPEIVKAAPASPPAGSSSAASSLPASSSVPAVQSDDIQRRPRSARIRGATPAAATAAIVHTPPARTDDSQQPSADTSATVTTTPSTQGAPVPTPPESKPSASSPSAQPQTSSTPSIPRATPAPFEPPETSAPSPKPAGDAVPSSTVHSPDLPPSSVQREDARQPADSADNPNTNAAPGSRSSVPGSPASSENQSPGSQPPSQPQNVPVTRPATAPPSDSATGTTAPPSLNTPTPATTPDSTPPTQVPTTESPNTRTDPAASSPAAPQPAAVDGAPSSTPLSGTSDHASAPVLSDAPLQRRATTTHRAEDAGARKDILDPHGASEPSTVTPSAAPSAPQSSTTTPTISPIQAASSSPSASSPQSTDSLPSEQSDESMQSPTSVESSETEQPQADQPNPALAGSPTTITVPADVRAAVTATTGVSPATASVVRGESVSKRARDLQADAFTHGGHVHLPGTAPLTSDRQRQLLAHELTHVVQQGSGRQLPPEHTPEGRRLEQKALDVESMLATASSNGAPSPNGPTSALPATASPPAMAPPVTNSTGVVPAASPAFASAPTPPGGRSRAAGVPRGATPTQRTPVFGTRVEASSSSDLVRVAAVPRSPRPAGRPQPRSGSATDATPIGQSTPSQANVAQASGLQPVALPVVTSQNPITSSENPMASSEPDRSVVQRRRAQAAPSSTPVPPTTPSSSPPAADPGAMAGQEPSDYRRSPTKRDNSTPDDAWLERHAAALYPIIRRHLRNELLRDRERRGRLVRED
jgi:hypothetical protein